ncbi:magnesium transporter CorA family protein, partial [Myxococcota bacterium]|nr:magnesium transporter CorA family protein [Myxococcota bacterium]
ARVRALGLLAGLSLERSLPLDEVARTIAEPNNLVWVDVESPGTEELSLLREAFGFHPLAIEDVANGQQRPKVDEYRGYMFVVTYAILRGDHALEAKVRELDLFIGRNYLVTVHRGEVPAIDEAIARWTRGGDLLQEGVGFLAYTVMDAVIDAYFPVVDAIGDELDAVESSLFSGFRDELVQRFLRVKRSLHGLRRVLSPMRETFTVFLRRDHPLFSPATQVYFHDVHDHVLRLLDTLEVQRDKVSGTTDAYFMMASHRMSLLVRTMTIVAIAGGLFAAAVGLWAALGAPAGPWLGVAAGTGLVLAGVAFKIGSRKGWS